MLGVLQWAKAAQVTLTAELLWTSRGQTWNCKQLELEFPQYAPCFSFCLKNVSALDKMWNQKAGACLLCRKCVQQSSLGKSPQFAQINGSKVGS